MKLRLLIALTILTIGITGSLAHAQTIPVSVNGLELSVSPQSPAPGQAVTFTAKSYVTDINAATVTWTVNGVRTKSGIGETTFSTKAPALGKTTTVNVTAVSPTGQTFYNNYSLKSGSIDLITESSGYTPPLFRGRLPISYQNMVRVNAIPHMAGSDGVEYSPATLIYKWEKDSGEVLSDQSGYGKQYVELKGAVVPRPYALTVTVSTKDGQFSLEKTVSIVPQAPSIVFYENDQLYGPLYNKALGDNISIGAQKETSVVAVPFGFDKALNTLGNLVLKWVVNGSVRTELSDSNIIVLRTPDGSAGVSGIELTINNNKEILQRSSGNFSATFRAGTSTSSGSDNLTF